MDKSLITFFAAFVLLLGGCAGDIDTSGAERVDDSAPTTMSASELAVGAEGVVLGQGFTVEIDCGTEDVPFVIGASLECAVLDPATGDVGGYSVTIASIDGVDYVLYVVGSAAPEPEPAAVFETAATFAELTAQAISSSLGEQPVVDCGVDDIELFEGNEIRCGYTASSTSGFVVSTISSFDGSSYAISVVEA